MNYAFKMKKNSKSDEKLWSKYLKIPKENQIDEK